MKEGFVLFRQPTVSPAVDDVATLRPSGDEALVAQAQKRNRDAWAQLYQKYYPEVYRRLRFLTGRVAIAEELTQECFVQAMLNIRQLRNGTKFKKWLSGIALNLARKYWRRANSSAQAYDGLRRLQDVSAGHGPDVEARVADHHRICAVYRLLEDVPEHLRMVFILRDIEGASAKEIAELLDISTNNVAVRATRARALLREGLGARGWLDKKESDGKAR